MEPSVRPAPAPMPGSGPMSAPSMMPGPGMVGTRPSMAPGPVGMPGPGPMMARPGPVMMARSPLPGQQMPAVPSPIAPQAPRMSVPTPVSLAAPGAPVPRSPMLGQQPPIPNAMYSPRPGMPGLGPTMSPRTPMNGHHQPPASSPMMPPLPSMMPGPSPTMPGKSALPGQQQPPISNAMMPPRPGMPGLGQPMMPGHLQAGQHSPAVSSPMMPPGPPMMPGPGPSVMAGPGVSAMAGPPLPGQQPPLPSPMMPPPGPGTQYPGPPGPPGGPGYQPQMPPGPGMSRPGMQGAPQRKLDPDQMPSPIQVMADDQASRGGQFVTNLKGQVPPLCTTRFSVVDQGNASPRLMRSSMYNVPVSPDMLKQTAVPFAVSIAPLAELPEGEMPPPVVDLGELGPVRCIRCKAYMCPFMNFIDGGRRFSCPFCKANTEVPQEYFQHLDHVGQRLDKYERPELCMGSYEFVCTKEYCRNNEFPNPPAYIFIIDVSYNNVKSGLLHLLCGRVKELLRQLPVDVNQVSSNVRVGFITYSNVVHFYNVKACLAQPQMMVVGDVQDMFVPLVDGLLVDITEAEAVVDSLMEQLPTMFAGTRETEIVLGPAIQAGMEALKAANCAGRLFIFHSSLPIGEAPGKLKNRDDRKVLGSEKEKHVLTPQHQFYNNLGQECVQVGCSVNLFLLNNAYVDLATIGQAVRLTGGEVFKYTYFQADIDGERLLQDLRDVIARPVALDAIMRVRTSTGVRPVDFHGHFFMSNTTDMELAAIDSTQAVTVEIKHDDKLTDEDGVYIQAALLYTSCSGQRRLRVINLSLSVCAQMADLYRSCELDVMVNLMAKQALAKLLEQSPRAVKDQLTSQCAQILACYRKNCASPSSAGQLILPECMKLLPLYANCVLRSDAVAGGPDLTVDERSFHMYLLSSMPVARSVPYLYPRLLPLHPADPDATDLPAPVRCSQDKLADDGVFLLENGVHLFLWIGLQVRPEFIQDVFAVPSAAQIDVDKPSLPALDTPLSVRMRGIVDEVRRQRKHPMKLTMVRQRDKLEVVMRHFLVEDKGADGAPSYVDYLCHLHKEIRTLLS